MNLTQKQEFGVLAAVLRQPTLRNEAKIAKMLFLPKKSFNDERARWLAREIVITDADLEAIKRDAGRGQSWFFQFLPLMDSYSLPACLL